MEKDIDEPSIREKADAMRRLINLASTQSTCYWLIGKDFWEQIENDSDAAAMYDLFMAHRRERLSKWKI